MKKHLRICSALLCALALFAFLCTSLTACTKTEDESRNDNNQNNSETVADCSHEYESEIIKAATCTEAGTAEETCIHCGATQTKELPAGHDFTEATCTAPRICTRCNLREGEALGHTGSTPTCTEDGHCTHCGITTPSTGHDYEVGERYVANNNYRQDKVCKNCGDKKTETLDMAECVEVRFPSLPKTLTYSSSSSSTVTGTVTSITYTTKNNPNSGTVTITFTLTGSKTSDTKGDGRKSVIKANYNLYNANGLIVKDGTFQTPSVKTMEKFEDTLKITVDYEDILAGAFRLEISDK